MEKKLNDTQEYILSVLNSVIKATNEMNVKCYMQGGQCLGQFAMEDLSHGMMMLI